MNAFIRDLIVEITDEGIIVAISMPNGLPPANWKHKISLLLGRLEGFRVTGNSMTPTVSDGSSVLIKRTKSFIAGDIVLAHHPFKKSVKILKRIESITPDHTYFLIGDNSAESTDSRTLGKIPLDQIIGKAVCRLD